MVQMTLEHYQHAVLLAMVLGAGLALIAGSVLHEFLDRREHSIEKLPESVRRRLEELGQGRTPSPEESESEKLVRLDRQRRN